MDRIRPYLGHLVYGLAGTVTGTGSALLCLHALRPGLSLWAVGLIAGGLALTAIGTAAWVQRRHAARRRPRRRAHARPNSKTRKEAA